ncbi:hypothetical protein RJ641_032282 [Dillenia turbinata]|uniref:Uncharacterized protein n=1 Tax=Dillenia turbinata TaxID=194707 RepID=A0AAN8ZFB5_9MAGN
MKTQKSHCHKVTSNRSLYQVHTIRRKQPTIRLWLTNARSSISSDPQVQALLTGKEQGQRCQKNISVLPIASTFKNGGTRATDPLTQDEDHLKQILIKSQLFLSAAEALFKFNIPVSILHAGIDGYPLKERFHRLSKPKSTCRTRPDIWRLKQNT